MQRRNFIKGSAIIGLSIAAGQQQAAISGMYSDSTRRQIYRILRADGVNVGTLPVMRAFAGNHLDHVSPFVLLDEFGPIKVEPGTDPMKVEAHPHAGVTPTTYFVEGTGHHKDSLDYDFQIGKGDFMMFSSGKGAIHMEESGKLMYEKGGTVHGFQIWLNTPAKYKWDDPFTIVHRTDERQPIVTKDYSIQVVLGELGDVCSDIETRSEVFYYHIKMNKDSRLDINTDPTHNAFVYMINGELELEGNRSLKDNHLVLYERGASEVGLYATEKSEFLMLGGAPLNEPVFSYGPFVMNNEEEIKRCIHNYNNGLMGDPDIVNR